MMDELIKNEYVITSSPKWFSATSSTMSEYYRTKTCGYFFIAYSNHKILNIVRCDTHNNLDSKNLKYSYITSITPYHSNLCSIKFVGKEVLYLLTCSADHYFKIYVYENDRFVLYNSKQMYKDVCSVITGVQSTNSSCLISCATASNKVFVGAVDRLSDMTQIKACSEYPLHMQWKEKVVVTEGTFAVAFRNGYVCIYKYFLADALKPAKLIELSTIKAHDKVVCKMSWFTELDKLFIFTCGRDRLIKKWSVDDEKIVASYRVPMDKKVKFDSEMPQPWITLTVGGALFFSNNSGKIFKWNRVMSDKPECISEESHQHCKIVSNIEHLETPDAVYLISFGHDRMINVLYAVKSNLEVFHHGLTILCNSDSKVCLSAGSTSNAVVGLGCSDGLIKLLRPNPTQVELDDCECGMFNLANQTYRLDTLLPFGTTSSGISCICWHPDEKHSSILAIGTESGLIGSLDTNRLQTDSMIKSLLHLQSQAIGRIIYRVAWGPIIFSGNSDAEKPSCEGSNSSSIKYCVYGCGKSKLFCQPKMNGPLIDISNQFNSMFGATFNKFSDIVFRITGEPCIHGLVADVDGKLGLFKCESGDVAPLVIVKTAQKSVNALAFSLTPGAYMLAAGSNNSFISVADYSSCVTEQSTEAFRIPVITDEFCRLTGHMNRIVDLEFNPHNSDQLLSASYDRTVTLWSLQSKTALANFRGHLNRVVSARWSPFETDLVFSSDEGSMVHAWRPSKQGYMVPPNTRRSRIPVGHSEMTPVTSDGDTHSSAINITETEDVEVQEDTKNTIFEDMGGLLKKKKTRTKRAQIMTLFRNSDVSDMKNQFDLSRVPPIQFNFTQLCLLYSVGSIPGHSMSLDLCPMEALLLNNTNRRKKLLQLVLSDVDRRLTNSVNISDVLLEVVVLYLWIGYSDRVVALMQKYDFNPFWLLWCLELSRGYSPFNDQRLDKCSKSQIDLVDMKVKAMSKSMENVFITSAVLVCAGRTLDAVRLLFSNHHEYDALLLAQIRLFGDRSSETVGIIDQCAEQLKGNFRGRGLVRLSLLVDLHRNDDKSFYKSLLLGARLDPLEQLCNEWVSLALASARPPCLERTTFMNEFPYASFSWRVLELGLHFVNGSTFSTYQSYILHWVQSLSSLNMPHLHYIVEVFRGVHSIVDKIVSTTNAGTLNDVLNNMPNLNTGTLDNLIPDISVPKNEFFFSQFKCLLEAKPKETLEETLVYLLLHLAVEFGKTDSVNGVVSKNSCDFTKYLSADAEIDNRLGLTGLIGLKRIAPDLFYTD